MRDYKAEFIKQLIKAGEQEKRTFIAKLMDETRNIFISEMDNRDKLKEILAACDAIEALDISSLIRNDVTSHLNQAFVEYKYGDVWGEGYLELDGSVTLLRGGIFKKTRGHNLKYSVSKWRDRIFEMRETHAISSPIIKNFAGEITMDSLVDATSVLLGQNCGINNETMLKELTSKGEADGWKIVDKS